MNRFTPTLFALVFVVSISALGCTEPETRNNEAVDAQQMAGGTAFGLSADRLHFGTVTSDMTLHQGADSIAIGVAVEEIGRGMLGGRDVIQLILVQEVRAGTMRDTLFVDARTLLPVRYRNEMPGMQAIEVEYEDNGHVASEVVRGDVVTGIDTVLVAPFLDAAEFSMLIPALPLAEGYSAEIPVVHYENGPQTNSVRVVSSESLDYQGELRDVWLVDHVTPAGSSRHSVDKETGRVLRVVTDLGDGRRFEKVAR